MRLIGVVDGIRDDPTAPNGKRYVVVTHGRAKCKVSFTNTIEAGTLLVPSSIDGEKGVAQPADWYIQPGTLIGKSLRPVIPDTSTPNPEGTAGPSDQGKRHTKEVDILVTLG